MIYSLEPIFNEMIVCVVAQHAVDIEALLADNTVVDHVLSVLRLVMILIILFICETILAYITGHLYRAARYMCGLLALVNYQLLRDFVGEVFMYVLGCQ